MMLKSLAVLFARWGEGPNQKAECAQCTEVISDAVAKNGKEAVAGADFTFNVEHGASAYVVEM